MTLTPRQFLHSEPPPTAPAASPWTLDGLGNQDLLVYRNLVAPPPADDFVRPLEQNPWWLESTLSALGV